MGKYYVYILESDKGYHYIGQTNDLIDRLHRHNTGRSTYTKNKGHWEIVIFVEANTRAEAVQLEMKLKRMKNIGKAINYLRKIKSESVSSDNKNKSSNNDI